MEELFSELSIELSREISKAERKKHGIYFTPKNIVDHIINSIDFSNIKTILEPSAGSGEFIQALLNKIEHVTKITGVEYHEKVFEGLVTLELPLSTELYNEDFLKWESPEKFDLIIGNPPYFVILKKDTPARYLPYIIGRPNIYTIILLKSLELLNDGGILAFVLPINFLNSHYYDEIRKRIAATCTICDIKEHPMASFIGADQTTCSLIIQNAPSRNNNRDYVFETAGFTIFSPEINSLRSAFAGSSTLDELEFEVKVGTVVWNQVKSILTDDPAHTRLIYSGDLADTRLDIQNYKNPSKKNYILKEGRNGPLLIVNRGYGTGKYKFKYCMVDLDSPYLIENHIIMIVDKGGHRDYAELVEMYELIMESFADPRTKKFIEMYFKNNAINTTELQYMFPVFI